MRRYAALLTFFLAHALYAQLNWNTVSVTAARNPDLQPDQAIFSIRVTASADKGLNDIVNALAGSGIAATDLAGVSSSSQGYQAPGTPPGPVLDWGFQFTVPAAKVKDTIAQLSTLQQNLPQKNSGLSMTFTMQGTSVSPQSQQQQTCSLAGLVSDARAQAQKLAGAAGLSPGAIVGLSSATSSPYAVPCSLGARFALGGMFARTEPDAITITASRTFNPQPDQVLIAINVTSSGNAGLDEIVALLQGTGITASDLMNVQSYTYATGPGPQAQTNQQWSFSLTAPLSKMSDTLTALLAAQQAVVKKGGGFGLAFSVAGLQVSPALQKTQVCPQADLMADARAQAQKVAAAAGVSVGAVLSMADTGGAGVAGAVGYPVAAARVGFFFASPFFSYGSSTVSTYAGGCALTAQFQLLR